MTDEHYVICGEAAPRVPETAKAVRLHLYGADDKGKITLRINELQEELFKEVPARFRDLLEIAAYVYTADQAIVRGARDCDTFGSHWRRDLRFHVPVRDLDFWQAAEVRACLAETLGFLSDDHYTFEFIKLREQDPFQRLMNFNRDGELLGFPEQVVMYSGGLDSLGGAVEEAVNQRRRVVLVNHRATPKLDKRYALLRNLISAKAPNNPPAHVRVTMHKKKWMNREHTQRSRSFLYVAIGATIAEMLGQSSVRFYENGVISLNLPLCAQVVGGKATRTTHPKTISGFEALVSLVADRRFEVANPFQWKTKSEVVELIAKAGCAELIAESISCTHTKDITNEQPHCGYCTQCVDRRFAVMAAGQEQHDPLIQYRMDVFTESRSRYDHVNEDKTLFANYMERANEAGTVSGPLQFLKRFPEVARTLKYVDGDPGATVQRCYEMYRRHSSEVNRVIERLFALHGTAIRERTLPVDAMLRMVYESVLPTSMPVVPSQDTELPQNVFRRHGEAWQVRFQGRRDFTVLPSLGADYICRLLASPGESLSAIETVCGAAADHCSYLIAAQQAVDAGLRSGANPLLETLGKISDWQAVKAYRKEAKELRADIERARAEHNEPRVLELQQDMAILIAKIHESVGVGGKLKEAGDKRKSIRDGFRNAVKRVINKVRETDAALADHFDNSFSYGNYPKYEPADPISWEIEPVINF